MDQWVELSQITISGAMTRKEDFLPPSRSYKADRVRRSMTWPATSLSVCCQWTHFILPFHFSPYYITFFFFCVEGDYPAFQPSHHLWSRWGAWAIPRTHGHDWCALCSHARTPSLTPKLFLRLRGRIPCIYTNAVVRGIAVLYGVLSHLRT